MAATPKTHLAGEVPAARAFDQFAQLDLITKAVVAEQFHDLLAGLIAADSQTPPGDCRETACVCTEWLSDGGIPYEISAAEEHLPNVIVRVGPDGGHELCWNAHLDTVRAGDLGAWATDPFSAEVVDGEYRGLGAANCKASAAAQLCATVALLKADQPLAGQLVITLVSDEESLGSRGTGYLWIPAGFGLDTLSPAARLATRSSTPSAACSGRRLKSSEGGRMGRYQTRARTPYSRRPG